LRYFASFRSKKCLRCLLISNYNFDNHRQFILINLNIKRGRMTRDKKVITNENVNRVPGRGYLNTQMNRLRHFQDLKVK